jgi:uncharacterized protein (TIGR02453 family)
MIAGGIWMPPAPALAKIREALAEHYKKFETTVRTMRRRFSALSEEAVLQRLPRGYTEDHPAARWLRYKSFTSHRMLTAAELRSPRLPDTLAKDFTAIIPFVRWLNSALGLPPATRR